MKKKGVWLSFPALLILCGVAIGEQQDLGFDLDKHLGTHWYGVYMSGKKCGYSSATMKKIKRDGQPCYSSSMDTSIILSVMGVAQKLRVIEKTVFLASGPILESSSSMGPLGSYRGVVEGDQMRLVATIGGMKTEKMIPAPRNTLRDEVGPMRLVLGKPKIGDSIQCTTFDPTAGKNLESTVSVTGKKTILFNGVQTDVYEINVKIEDMGLNSPMLVTENADVLQLTFPIGAKEMALRREDEKVAKDQSVEVVEMLDASSVRPDGDMPDVTQIKELKLRITGLADEKCVVDDARQKYTKQDGSYELLLQKDTLPENPPNIPMTDKDVAEFTKPTELYQSGHPDVVEKAKEIVGGEANSIMAAEKLCNWVFTNVKKKGTASFSNTLETLRKMEGDCSEHAALFVGLCRAAGLPARVATGIAYSKAFGVFGGHAWAEVYVGKWVAVDPTFGEPVANPAHIKLVNGDSFIETARILSVLGKMKIEVIQPGK